LTAISHVTTAIVRGLVTSLPLRPARVDSVREAVS
jgi:hypothetical protein